MSNVTILNGPPGCGKDTLAKLIAQRTGALHKEFKEVLYVETANEFGVDNQIFYSNATNRVLKERKIYDTRYGLMSPREMLIHTSENVIKPMFGQAYFGFAAAESWLDSALPSIVSDGGFSAEIEAVCDTFGAANVMVIQLHREGYTFEGDSRQYISSSVVPCNVCYINLFDGEIESAYRQIQNLRKEFFKDA